MSEVLATSPALPGEAPTVEGRLADLMENAEVRVDDYRLSDDDRAKVVAALRGVLAGKLPCDVHLPPYTYVRKGCDIETALLAINVRKGFPEADTVFPR